MSTTNTTSHEIAVCGVSVSPDRSQVTLYLGPGGGGEGFEAVLPKELAHHLATTILKLAPRTPQTATVQRP